MERARQLRKPTSKADSPRGDNKKYPYRLAPLKYSQLLAISVCELVSCHVDRLESDWPVNFTAIFSHG